MSAESYRASIDEQRRINDEIENTRKALYSAKTDEQMIMLALIDILKRLDGAPVIIRELYTRYRREDGPCSKT